LFSGNNIREKTAKYREKNIKLVYESGRFSVQFSSVMKIRSGFQALRTKKEAVLLLQPLLKRRTTESLF